MLNFKVNFKIKISFNFNFRLEIEVQLQAQLQRFLLVLAPSRSRDYVSHGFFCLRLLLGGCFRSPSNCAKKNLIYSSEVVRTYGEG